MMVYMFTTERILTWSSKLFMNFRVNELKFIKIFVPLEGAKVIKGHLLLLLC